MIIKRLKKMLTEGGLSADEATGILNEVLVHTSMMHSPFKTWTCHPSELSGDVRGYLAGLCSAIIDHHLGHQEINNPAMKRAMEKFMKGEECE